MIQYFFIIDFLENVVMQRPKPQKPKFSPSIRTIKKMCLEHCKDHDFRYIDEIVIKNQEYKILARSTEDNMIVGVLVDTKTTKRAKIWKMLDDIVQIVSAVEDKEEGLKDIKRSIDEVLEKVIEPDTTDKINISLNSQVCKVEKLINEQKVRIQELEDLDLNVKELEVATEQQVQDSRSLYWEAYWYNKKLQLFIAGAIIIVLFFVIVFCWKLIPGLGR